MEHLNSSISAGERTSRVSVPQLQASHMLQTRVSRPQKQKQPQASAPAFPEESSDSEGESHNNILYSVQETYIQIQIVASISAPGIRYMLDVHLYCLSSDIPRYDQA